MGEVVQFKDFYEARAHTSVKLRNDGLVPLQFGVGFNELDTCQQKLAEYGITAIHSRELQHPVDFSLHFISVADALWINKKILENERLSEQVIRQRIDLLQMLENVDPWLMEGIWDSLTRTNKDKP